MRGKKGVKGVSEVIKKESRKVLRTRRHKRVRKTLLGTQEVPRLSVFKSLNHIYLQLIDDQTGKTLVSASTLDKELQKVLKKGFKKTEAAKQLGEIFAKRAIEKGIDRVVFDRGGYKYHGTIAAVADGARAQGLKF